MQWAGRLRLSSLVLVTPRLKRRPRGGMRIWLGTHGYAVCPGEIRSDLLVATMAAGRVDQAHGMGRRTTPFRKEAFMKVYTPINPDLDAVASVWAAREFIPGAREAELVFVPTNWDAAEMEEGDLALDINAAGRGIKGTQHADGTVGSCFVLLMSRYAPADDQWALHSLQRFVDAQDSTESAVKSLAPYAYESERRVLADTGINAVLLALQGVHPRNDTLVMERMAEIFSGMLQTGRARQRAVIEANRAELIGDGQVAIVRDNQECATNAILFERGVRVIVYVDGHNIGVVREGSMTLRMDDPALVEVIHAAGEELGDGDGSWFAHSAGFVLAWGTRKAPASSASRVCPEDLAMAAAQLLATTRTEH
jgi:hypothetical protein